MKITDIIYSITGSQGRTQEEILGYVYTGPVKYLGGQILGRLCSRPIKRSLGHCVHTRPVSHVYEMRIVRIVPNLFLVQSEEFGNVRNWHKKEKESEMNFILADDSV